ncbi:MAG: PRD domain-containing protein [Oscillospiraceae bacterium]|nr:PRD domain-containing protein [Oscillospiraceae bacterium]
MKIARVLNTNAVITKDDQGNEIVLLGPGLGFKHRPGDLVEEDKVEKVFHLENKEHQNQFQELLNNIPEAYIFTAENIINKATEEYGLRLGESIHISLADHIKHAVDNQRDGLIIRNTILKEIIRSYKKEYAVGLYGVSEVNKVFGVSLAEDEAGFIAMHFVSSEYTNGDVNTKKIIQVVSSINELVTKELGLTPDETVLEYQRYVVHLNYLAERIVTKKPPEDQKKGNSILLTFSQEYPREYKCAMDVKEYIHKEFGYTVGNDEILFLLVHLISVSNL